ncbi:MAG: adenosylmethionine decarboxylase [Acidimicrobiia bacterium]|nr:adenosylmethionine decarboxylase [Acidimicrobiia bacterium]
MDETRVGVGRHIICEFWGASNLQDAGHTERALEHAVAAGKATLIKTVVHQFSPHGVTAVAVLAESHLSIHTWPEMGYAAVDYFTCGSHVDTDAMLGSLKESYQPERVETRELARGAAPESSSLAEFVEFEPAALYRAGYEVSEVLERRRTRFQDLMLFRHPRAGKILALDGIVQLTDVDTYVYHEVLTHPALVAHPDPRHIAVVGGGDAFIVAEALKHDSVEKVYLLELDDDVVEVSRKHFPEASAALADPRVEVHVADAFDSIASMRDELDVILVDLTDPIGQAARLFADPFYERCSRALRADGFLVAQTESLHFHRDTVRQCYETLAGRFPRVDLLWGALATYPGSFWTMAFASKGLDPTVARRRPALDTKLYDVDAHGWFFIPEPVRTKLLSAPAPLA